MHIAAGRRFLGKKSGTVSRPALRYRGLFACADGCHDEPCAEDESVAEAVVGHRADELVVDVHELEQVLLHLAAEQLPEPLLVLPEGLEQDADVGVGGIAMLIGPQLAVVEIGEDAVHLSRLPSDRHEAVARAEVDAVVIHVICVDVVSDVRAGVNDVRDFLAAPRPEPLGVRLVLGRDLGADLEQRHAVAPRIRLVAERVVERADHPPHLVDVPHEQVVAVFVAVVLDDGFGERQSGEGVPVARWHRERVAAPSRDILDFVFRAVIAEDDVSDLRDVLRAVGRERHRPQRERLGVLRVWLVRSDADCVGHRIVLDRKSNRPADVAELAVVAPADGVRFDLHRPAVHGDLLARLLRRERRADRGRCDCRAEDDPRRDERCLPFPSVVLHAVFLLCVCFVNKTYAKGGRKSRRISLTKWRKRTACFWAYYLIIAVQILTYATLPEKCLSLITVGQFLRMPPRAEQGCVDRVFAHAPNTGAASVSNRFAVSAPAGSEPKSKIANNGATGGNVAKSPLLFVKCCEGVLMLRAF